MSQLVVVHGTGLIGGSIGLGLAGQGWSVAGWDPDTQRLGEALDRGAVHEILVDNTAGLDEADLVVLAGPAREIAAALPEMNCSRLVTDVAGVKSDIVEAAAALPHFVGGHPMAGGTSIGPSLASATLFHGAAWALTTDGTAEADLERMYEVVRSLGANPISITAQEHDNRVARVSHLPHVIAAALTGLVHEDDPSMSLAGGGFRDLTRVAGATGTWWADILADNSDHVAAALTDMIGRLSEWRDSVEHQDRDSLRRELDEARSQRSHATETQARVGVILRDRPGEIAKVGRALEASKVDVRDFQLRHAEHGGGGVLTITVVAAGADKLRSALTEHGFELQSDSQR